MVVLTWTVYTVDDTIFNVARTYRLLTDWELRIVTGLKRFVVQSVSHTAPYGLLESGTLLTPGNI